MSTNYVASYRMQFRVTNTPCDEPALKIKSCLAYLSMVRYKNNEGRLMAVDKEGVRVCGACAVSHLLPVLLKFLDDPKPLFALLKDVESDMLSSEMFCERNVCDSILMKFCCSWSQKSKIALQQII